MSAWVVALGLSAGYLINKQLSIAQKLDESIKEVTTQKKPAEPGPSTEAIRDVQRTVPDADKFQDMNLQDLSAQRVQELGAERERAHREVAQFEAGPPPVQGVYLNLSDRGV